MKIRLALLICTLAVILTACGYHLVEEDPVQVGSAVVLPAANADLPQ